MGPTEPWNQKQVHYCFFCGGPGGTKHHLIPRAVVALIHPTPKTETVRACEDCHQQIHFYFSHWELALKYNSEEQLRTEFYKRKQWKLTLRKEDQ